MRPFSMISLSEGVAPSDDWSSHRHHRDRHEPERLHPIDGKETRPAPAQKGVLPILIDFANEFNRGMVQHGLITSSNWTRSTSSTWLAAAVCPL
jgi:hypothetical protein